MHQFEKVSNTYNSIRGHIINKKGEDTKSPEDCESDSWQYLDETGAWAKDEGLTVSSKLNYSYDYQIQSL